MKVSDIKLWTALITPFNNSGDVDLTSYKNLINLQISAGIKGLLLFGSTGEAATLSTDEMEELAAVTKTLKKDSLVMMGVTHNNTAIAVEKVKQACAWGADVLLVAPPYYNKPSSEGMRRHFIEISKAAGSLPIVLYNIPARVGVTMDLDLIRELSRLDNVIGIKEASENLLLASQLYEDGQLSVWSGDDSLLLPFMSVGALGGISVSSNLFPSEFLSMVNAFSSGDNKKATRLSSAFSQWYPKVFAESNPIGIKAAMSIKGLIENELRMPLCPMSAQHAAQVNSFLSSFTLSCAEEA